MLIRFLVIGWLSINAAMADDYAAIKSWLDNNTHLPEAQRAEVAVGVLDASRTYHISPDGIMAIISIESAYRPYARGTKGELGLMQVMPGQKNLLNIYTNIQAGTERLLFFVKKAHGNMDIALQYYNGAKSAAKKRRYIDRYNAAKAPITAWLRAYQLGANAAISDNPALSCNH